MNRFDSPKAMVQAVMWTAQKARSNIAELNVGDAGPDLFPNLWSDGWDNVLSVADRMLADGRQPTGLDAYNLSYLIHRDDALATLLNVGVVAHGYEAFPEPDECLTRWGVNV